MCYHNAAFQEQMLIQVFCSNNLILALLVHRNNTFASKYPKVFHNEIVEVRGENCALVPEASLLSLARLGLLKIYAVFIYCKGVFLWILHRMH